MSNFNIHSHSEIVSQSEEALVLSCHLAKEWEIWGPNGGYLSAIALRAVSSLADGLSPISLHTQYFRVGKFEEAKIVVKQIRRGRSVANYEVTLLQNDKALIRTAIILGKENEGLAHRFYQKPHDFGSRENLPDFDDNGKRSPFWNNFNLKPVNWDGHQDNNDPRCSTWFEFKGEMPLSDPFLDYARSVVLVDTMLWPAAHNAYEEPLGYIAPSLDLHVKFHERGVSSPWLFCEAESEIAERGLISGSGRIFDEQGALLASGGSQMYCRQLP